jgi:hypothetical protein
VDSSDCARYVSLRTGLTLPVEPILLALELESRGFSLVRQDGDVLSVQPWQCLTSEDCAAISRWKWHLLSIVDYEPSVVQ